MFSIGVSIAKHVFLWTISSHVNRPLHVQKIFAARFSTDTETRQIDKVPSLNGLDGPAASPGLVQSTLITVDRILTE